MTPLPTPPAAACRRLHRLALRRSAVVTAVLVTIIGAPLVVGAVANDDGSAVPTGATVVAVETPVETPVEPARKPRVQVVEDVTPEPDTTAVAVAASAVANRRSTSMRSSPIRTRGASTACAWRRSSRC